MKSYRAAVILALVLAAVPSYIIHVMGSPPPVATTAWCYVDETDGEYITPPWADRWQGEWHPADLFIMGEIHNPGDKVPCKWLDRKPAV